ncbi:hypothetical protein LAZ67_22001722 [Cordylochernes scorpioides]|uniref:Transposase n=1 Tax=Cordylochernes scorpioides TaxID=51811 RepID=A0ABY6LP54_9ARAC|nr:hypothetical protein LAZ67_22001722 [Cordylochernes scorpioides]
MPGHRKRRQFKQTDAFTRGMVIGLKRAGWSIRQIAADTHLGASTVHRLWRRWLEQGNVAIYRNAGATRVTSARVDRRILRQAVAAPQATCTAILQHVQDTLDHSISTRTISRRLVANGLHSCHESRFCLSSDSRRVRVWRRRGERSNPAAIVKRPTVRQRGIMVWGAIAYDSRSPLLRIQGTMTAQRYVDDVLRPVTLPYLQGVPNALYQQDNARPHTARISQQALQDHVWDIIGRRLHALPQPRSEDELWQMVEREGRAIPQDAIRTLIDSLPRRVAACIAVRVNLNTHSKSLVSVSLLLFLEHSKRATSDDVNLSADLLHRVYGISEGEKTQVVNTDFFKKIDAAIRRCWQKWVNNGRMQRQDGSGRPRDTTEREDRAIVRTAVAAPESTLSTIQRVTGTQVSKMTINRRLRERNLRARRPLRCLPLTPVHRQLRLQWCQERSTWNCADWGRIVFSDESCFSLSPDDRRKRIWRRPGQRVDPGLTVEHHTGPQQGVMVWGAISFDSRTPLVVIPGTLTAQRYVDDILRPVLLPFLSHHPGLTFQQDNSRPHTTHGTKDCLQYYQTLPWPARSLDLLPIEHIWDVMGRRLQP